MGYSPWGQRVGNDFGTRHEQPAQGPRTLRSFEPLVPRPSKVRAGLTTLVSIGVCG